jgi:hypothetical protein
VDVVHAAAQDAFPAVFALAEVPLAEGADGAQGGVGVRLAAGGPGGVSLCHPFLSCQRALIRHRDDG